MIDNSLEALAICAECPIKEACRAEGMKPENIDNGIWGGTLAGERIAESNAYVSQLRKQQIRFADRVRAVQTV